MITLYKRHGWDYANETRWRRIRERTPATEVCDDHCPVTNAYARIQVTLGSLDRLSLELRVIGIVGYANWKSGKMERVRKVGEGTWTDWNPLPAGKSGKYQV